MQRAEVHGVVLAAGKGTRMHSERPKVMQEILGQPLVWYVVRALQSIVGQTTLVTGHGADEVEAFPLPGRVGFVRQLQQLGTGHALQTAWPSLQDSGAGYCLVVNGDTPLLREEDLSELIRRTIDRQADLAFLTTVLDEPGSYGRVVRDSDGSLQAVVEAKDYDPIKHGRETGEVNAGVYCLRMDGISDLLFRLTADNKQQEYYITQLIDLGIAHGKSILGVGVKGHGHLFGINTPGELISNEQYLQRAIVQAWIDKGVVIRNPDAVRIGPRVQLEPGSELTGPCELYAETIIEQGATIESHTWIRQSRIGRGSTVRCFSHVEEALVHEQCIIGPYARLRPGAEVLDRARVGNFVEMKQSLLGKGSKANHLTYLGDAEIGENVNIGAGTITCNYDGKRKHKTTIRDRAFIGSNTALVAPVTIGEGVLVGAGSTITKDVEEAMVAVARGTLKVYPRKK